MSRRLRAGIVLAALGVIAAVLVSVALFTDTGGSGGADVDGPPLAGCHEVEAKELYVQHAYVCDDGTRIVTFATGEARDNYLKVAEGFGTVTVDRGLQWARVR
jgi:hypothetical protein